MTEADPSLCPLLDPRIAADDVEGQFAFEQDLGLRALQLLPLHLAPVQGWAAG